MQLLFLICYDWTGIIVTQGLDIWNTVWRMHANEQQGADIPMQSAAQKEAGRSDDESIPCE